MITKYHIEYTVEFRQHAQHHHYQTDDPVACVEFLSELLEHGFIIRSVKHEGIELSRHEFDKLLKSAAHLLAARHLRRSLGITAEEERFRFGFAA